MEKKIALKAREGAAKGFPGFVAWLADTHPKLYSYVAASDPSTVAMLEQRHVSGSVLGDVAETPAKPAIQQLIDTVVNAGAAILPLVQQQKILKLQLQRAKAGLPPLDVGEYVDPNAGLNVGLNPATQRLLLWLGGGAVAAFVLSRLLRR